MSLPQVAAALLRQRLTVIGVTVVAFVAVCAVTFSLPAEYDATATLAVGGNRPLSTGGNSVEVDQTLARTYTELLQTPSANAEAVRALPFSIRPGELAGKVAFEAVGGTALIRIRATDRDPRRAQLIANAYASRFVGVQQEALIAAAREALQRSNQRLRELALRMSQLRESRDPEAVADLEQVRTELAAERDAYRAHRQSIALQGSNLSVASPAREPPEPARPRPKLYLVLGAAFALVLGVFGGVLRDSFDTRVRYEEDLVQLLGGPVLARVPRLGVAGEQSGLLEFQLLRSNVELHDPEQRVRTIGLTSAARGEGKTLVAAGLARALALIGARVTAMDCDLRQPALHARLGVEGGRGLSEALLTPSLATRLLQHTESPNLGVLPAGSPPSAAALLTKETFSRVLDELSGSEDYVICDMPPVTLGADAAAAAASVDAVIVVVDWGSARSPALLAVREQLENSGTRVFGVVLNRVRSARRSYVRPRYGSRTLADSPATDRQAGASPEKASARWTFSLPDRLRLPAVGRSR
jgi:capsular exopolysaccharide synthesis family protein